MRPLNAELSPWRRGPLLPFVPRQSVPEPDMSPRMNMFAWLDHIRLDVPAAATMSFSRLTFAPLPR